MSRLKPWQRPENYRSDMSPDWQSKYPLHALVEFANGDFEIDVETGPDKFAEEVRRLTDEMNQVQLGVIHSLTPIQSSVLRVMAATRENYAPFEAATMEKYRKAMTQAGLAVDDAAQGGGIVCFIGYELATKVLCKWNRLTGF